MHIVNAADIAQGKKAPDTLGVKAINDTTLEVTLTQPNAAFLAMLAHPSLVPVDKVLIGRFGDKWTKPEHMVTSGAYKLSQWVVNERIVAERNARSTSLPSSRKPWVASWMSPRSLPPITMNSTPPGRRSTTRVYVRR